MRLGLNSSSRFFAGAAILGAGLALKFGGPLVPVAIGVAAVAVLNWWNGRRALPRTK